MRTAMVIAAREVREKARLFVVCAGLALVPFAATLLPGTQGQASDVIAVVGGFLSVTLGLGIAVTLGGSTIVGDLVERRMSFYFTKPVGAGAMWLGKAAAGVFISLACFAIVAGPAFVTVRRQWTARWLGEVPPLLGAAVVIVVVFFACHALATMIRSRSPLLALDFLFATAALAGLYLIVRPLLLAAAIRTMAIIAAAVAVAVVLVLVIAPVWQLANGRSDLRRSHAALMRFLWPAVAVVLLVAGGGVAWIVHVTPADLTVEQIEQPGRGSLLLLTGKAPRRGDYQPTFLIDRAVGKVTRLAALPLWGTQLSEDGRVAVWLQPFGMWSRASLELHSTRGKTPIAITPSVSYVLSGDGSRVAAIDGTLATVYDLATGTILGSAAGFDGRTFQQMFFVTPDVVRIYEHGTTLRISELDVSARQLRRTGELPAGQWRQAVHVSRDGSRMFVPGLNVIADARTGAVLARIGMTGVMPSRMLHDGRVAILERPAGAARLRIYDREGVLRHDIALPQARRHRIAGETEEGKLLLASSGPRMVVVDAARGVIERTLEGIRGPIPQWTVDPRLIRYAAGQELAAVDAKGALVTWSVARPVPRPLLP